MGDDKHESGGCACCGFIMMILAAVLFGVHELHWSKRLKKAEGWIAQDWTATECTVLESGISYWGSCGTVLHQTAYTECTQNGGMPQDKPIFSAGWTGRKHSTACIDHGDRLWDVFPVDDKVATDATTKRLRRLNDECSHRYLAWALVKIQRTVVENGESVTIDAKRCAFRWGPETPSIESSWDNADALKDALVPDETLNCLVLGSDSEGCVVGLEDPQTPMPAWFDNGKMLPFSAGLAAFGGCFFCVGLLHQLCCDSGRKGRGLRLGESPEGSSDSDE